MDKIDFHIRPNDEYNELWFEFSNGTKGKIAFCDEHYEIFKDKGEISEEDSDRIMNGIKQGWKREFILNRWSKEKIDKYKQDFFSLKILRRLTDEEVSAN